MESSRSTETGFLFVAGHFFPVHKLSTFALSVLVFFLKKVFILMKRCILHNDVIIDVKVLICFGLLFVRVLSNCL